MGTITQGMSLCFENNSYQLGIIDSSFINKNTEYQRDEVTCLRGTASRVSSGQKKKGNLRPCPLVAPVLAEK